MVRAVKRSGTWNLVASAVDQTASKGDRKAAQARLTRERDAVQLMRRLKVAEEEGHHRARRQQAMRPEKARVLFDLSRQAFQLHDAMQRLWPTVPEGRRIQFLGAAEALLAKIEDAA